jgi:hypothetical protein
MRTVLALTIALNLAGLAGARAAPLVTSDIAWSGNTIQIRGYCGPGLEPIGRTGDCRPIHTRRPNGTRQRAGNNSLAPTPSERAVDRQINTLCRGC